MDTRFPTSDIQTTAASNQLPAPHDMELSAPDALLLSSGVTETQEKNSTVKPYTPKKHHERHFTQKHSWIHWTPAVIGLLVGLFVGATLMNEANIKSSITQQNTAILSVTPVAPIVKKTEAKAVRASSYKSSKHQFSFDYPSDWSIVELSSQFSANGITTYDVLTMNPSTIPQTSIATPIIHMYYYYNPELLTIEAFNQKYLSRTAAPNSQTIWSPTYKKVTTVQGVSGYFDKAHYCVVTCQMYVWAHQDKIFVIKTSPQFIPNGHAIPELSTFFDTLFSSLEYATVPSPLPTAVISPSNAVVCTADAKLCPDGSYVSRTGPRCQFAACPKL